MTRYLQQASSNALDTASKVQADLEARAKSAGIPVDDYKSRASSAFTDLTENVEARAKAAGIPVAEYKEKAEEIIDELRKRAGEVGGYLEGKAGEAKEKAGEVQKEAGKKAGQVQKEAGKKMGEVQEKAGEVQKEAGKKAGEVQEKAGDVAKDAQNKGESAVQIQRCVTYTVRQTADDLAEGAAKQNGKQDKRTRQDCKLSVVLSCGYLLYSGDQADILQPTKSLRIPKPSSLPALKLVISHQKISALKRSEPNSKLHLRPLLVVTIPPHPTLLASLLLPRSRCVFQQR